MRNVVFSLQLNNVMERERTGLTRMETILAFHLMVPLVLEKTTTYLAVKSAIAKYLNIILLIII